LKKNWQNDREYMGFVGELLETEEVRALEDFVQHQSSNRLEHSINVSYTSYKIAKRLNGNTRSTARAALLHDLFFYDWRETKFQSGSHAYMHPRIALKNAEKLTELNEIERDIIVKHMWGATVAPPKYKESFIVTMVDKYWAIREGLTPVKRKFTRKKTIEAKV
jgi:uncharacterized protein